MKKIDATINTRRPAAYTACGFMTVSAVVRLWHYLASPLTAEIMLVHLLLPVTAAVLFIAGGLLGTSSWRICSITSSPTRRCRSGNGCRRSACCVLWRRCFRWRLRYGQKTRKSIFVGKKLSNWQKTKSLHSPNSCNRPKSFEGSLRGTFEKVPLIVSLYLKSCTSQRIPHACGRSPCRRRP